MKTLCWKLAVSLFILIIVLGVAVYLATAAREATIVVVLGEPYSTTVFFAVLFAIMLTALGVVATYAISSWASKPDTIDASRFGALQKRDHTKRIMLGVAYSVITGLGLLAAYSVVQIHFVQLEQQSWHPRDHQRLTALGCRYTREGTVLDLHAPAGVAEVWKRDAGLAWPPWRPHYYRVAFRVIGAENDPQIKVLVDYEFSPGDEWFLAIQSKDGYWTSMSPYFPAEPNMTDEKWEELVAASRLVVPDE